MYDSIEEAQACPRGDVILRQDKKTGIVHNCAFQAALVNYDKSYQNEQSYSLVFRRHLEDVTAVVERNFSGLNIIEVGCGRGTFLDVLRKRGFAATGIDPAYDGDSAYISPVRFHPELRLDANAVILRHVLEHVPEPLEFLATLASSLGGRGVVLIEVPCLEWIARHRAWFDIFYEHVNYFRASDFHRIFGRVRESGHLFGGQYLYVVAELASLRQPKGWDLESLPENFAAGLDRAIDSARKQARCAIWGAGAKGAIFAHYLVSAGIQWAIAIDINPSKQGKFLAGSGVRVSSPDEALGHLRGGDLIYVMNSNYLGEIRDMSSGRFSYCTVDRDEL